MPAKLNYSAEADIKQELLQKILSLQCKDLDTFDTGTLVSRATSDTSQVITFVFEFITSVVTITINILAALFFAFQISAPLSVMSLLFIPFSILANMMFKNSFKALSKLQQEYRDALSAFLFGTIGHIPAIKAYCMEDYSGKKYSDLVQQGWGLQKRQIVLGNKSTMVSSTIASASTIATLLLSAQLIAKGVFTLGGMTSFQRYIDKLTGAVGELLQMNYSAQSAAVAVDRMTELMSMEDESVADGVQSVAFPIRDVSFKNVCFRYGMQKEVLRKVSISLGSTGLYALVGENGCGKSTVLKLLMRYYDASSGSILINGNPICSYPIKSLRKSIGYYQKNVYIQNDTLLANILLGSENMPDEGSVAAAWRVCEDVGLAEYIRTLPEGMFTKLGEDGKLLSSGQKQKLAIARAMLDQASILLFDEVTSDLDGEAEKKLLSILRELGNEKIVILITHRIQAVLVAERVILLEHGMVTACDTHHELLQKSERYRTLFKSQQTAQPIRELI